MGQTSTKMKKQENYKLINGYLTEGDNKVEAIRAKVLDVIDEDKELNVHMKKRLVLLIQESWTAKELVVSKQREQVKAWFVKYNPDCIDLPIIYNYDEELNDIHDRLDAMQSEDRKEQLEEIDIRVRELVYDEKVLLDNIAAVA